jgi:hypothetical protein
MKPMLATRPPEQMHTTMTSRYGPRSPHLTRTTCHKRPKFSEGYETLTDATAETQLNTRT